MWTIGVSALGLLALASMDRGDGASNIFAPQSTSPTIPVTTLQPLVTTPPTAAPTSPASPPEENDDNGDEGNGNGRGNGNGNAKRGKQDG